MKEQPLEKTFDRVVKELQKSVDNAMNYLQQGIQEYLTDSINITQLLKVIEKLGLPNIIEMTKSPTLGFDYYKVLGLEKTASNSEVKKRYKEIMAKIHPDVGGKEMTFLSALVNTAYEMIWKERKIT